MAGPGQEEGRVRPPQRETRYHGKDKLEGSREPDARLETHNFLPLCSRQQSWKNLIYQLSEKQ